MDEQRWSRVEELFKAAAPLGPADRESLLDRECAGNPELRREVCELLEQDDAAGVGDSMTSAVSEAAHDAVTSVDSARTPERVGAYRLDRELGVGGMGRVFLGVRDDDAFSKQVAVKLLTHGRFRPDLIQRFRTERQILATLEHPNIARLLDGGVTDGGDHYVVMEYVAGRSIHDHCEAETLTIEQRLELFCKICGAVQYAHDHSIVHRDLKPSNVLIAESGEPKLLDFGIAKLLGSESGLVPADETATSMRLMTPQYASPEQVRGEPITAATDVYALGVMLYELLTGQLPYRIEGPDLTRIEQAVCEQDPPPPSKLATMQSVARDLDNIVLTALRKEPEKRYGSAGELSADLRRYLEGRPVAARPATLGYRVSKFVKRRPASAALALTLALTLPTLGVLGVKVLRQHRVERLERIESLLKETRWLQDRRYTAKALDKAEEVLRLAPSNPAALRHRALARADEGDPGAEADATRLIAVAPGEAWPHAVREYVLEGLGRLDEARQAAETAATLRSERRSDEDLDISAQLALVRGEHAAAVELLTELISRSPDRPSAISSRAFAHEELGDPERAFIDYRVAIGIDPSQDGTLLDLARLSIERDEMDEAARYLARSFELRPDSAYAFEARGHLLLERGLQAIARGDDEAAQRLFVESERASLRSLELEPSMRWAGLNIATTLISRYRLAPAENVTLLEKAAEQYRAALSRWKEPPAQGEQRELFFTALNNGCDALIQLERLDQALEDCSRVTRLFPEEAVGFYNLAGVHALLNRHDEAIAALRRNFELGDDDWQYLSRDRWFEAVRGNPRFEELLDEMKQKRGQV